MEELKIDFEYKKEVLDALTEVEIFFLLQIYFSLDESKETEKIKFAYNYINKTLLPKFKVNDAGEYDSPRFYRWLDFWRNWQGSLTIIQLKDIVDCIELRQPYDKYLPKRRWNERRKKVVSPIGTQG